MTTIKLYFQNPAKYLNLISGQRSKDILYVPELQIKNHKVKIAKPYQLLQQFVPTM
jgi:hypothetical protein